MSALEADSERVRSAQEASRAKREASRDHIDFTKAMVLELGQRVGKLANGQNLTGRKQPADQGAAQFRIDPVLHRIAPHRGQTVACHHPSNPARIVLPD